MRGDRISIRRPALQGVIALALLVLGVGLWSVTATLSGAVVARGRIEVDQNRQQVQHPEGGVVAEVLTAEGARVTAGTVLLRLDGTALRAELQVIDLRLDDLAVRNARLLAERDGLPAPVFPPDLLDRAARESDLAAQIEGQRRLHAARLASLQDLQEQLAQRIVQVRAEIAGLAAQRQAVAAQLAIVQQDLTAQERLLAQELVPQAVVLALRRERAGLAGQLAGLQAATAKAEGQATEIGLQSAALTGSRSEEAATELRATEAEVLELQARRRALADRIARLELRAPVSGTVMALAVTVPGAVLSAGDPALSLVPSDRPLVIAAALSPIHVDEVAPGQHADLSFPAFPARDAPRLAGRVTQVSPDAAVDPVSGAAEYQLRIEIDSGELARLGDHALVPGMPVDIFLSTRARTPLAYLIEPFAAYFSRALRES